MIASCAEVVGAELVKGERRFGHPAVNFVKAERGLTPAQEPGGIS